MYRSDASTYPSDNRWPSQSQSHQAPLFFCKPTGIQTLPTRTPTSIAMDNYRRQPAVITTTTAASSSTKNSAAESWWAWCRKLLRNIITFPLLLLSGYIILGVMFGIAAYTLGCEITRYKCLLLLRGVIRMLLVWGSCLLTLVLG
ncbi:hypothetical protein B0T09DRAFT_77902 [Sordaria sp. MPI-SDFR-AT-0083]|nr:hypothetical protein B0T09DRAFT_77902 [Sordaria sp. MPI-SDFR-AT-0083]